MVRVNLHCIDQEELFVLLPVLVNANDLATGVTMVGVREVVTGFV
jgi:hypothetical protein